MWLVKSHMNKNMAELPDVLHAHNGGAGPRSGEVDRHSPSFIQSIA